jgi:hypothetical protein
MSTPFPQPGLFTDAKVIYTDESHTMGAVANVIVSFSIAEPSRVYLDAWVQIAKQLIAAHGTSAALHLIDGSAKPPSDEIRAELNRMLVVLGKGRLVGIANVVEGTGFLAAAKRSALSMIALMARSPAPMRIFGDSLEGSIWLVSQLRSSKDTTSRLHARAIAAGAEAMRHAHAAGKK